MTPTKIGTPPQLRYDRRRPSNRGSPPKRRRRHAANSNRLVNVFFQIHIERVFQKPRITVIVFGRDNDQPVAAIDHRRERWVLHLLACIIQFHWEFAHIDQFRLHIRALLCLLKNETRDVLALPSLTRSSENNGNKKRALHLSAFRYPKLKNCRWPDSNRHGPFTAQRILSPLRLPFRHIGAVRRILSLLCNRRKRISHLRIYIWSSRKRFVVHVMKS